MSEWWKRQLDDFALGSKQIVLVMVLLAVALVVVPLGAIFIVIAYPIGCIWQWIEDGKNPVMTRREWRDYRRYWRKRDAGEFGFMPPDQ